jgi:Ca2+/H+ antiporter
VRSRRRRLRSAYPRFFLGVIVLAVVGNAAEYFASIYFAR